MKSFAFLVIFLSIYLISYSQINITPVSIKGGCSSYCGGNATFSISGGSSPYNYTFTPAIGLNTGINSQGIWVQNLCGGTYTLNVTDQTSSSSSYTFSTIQSSPTSVISTTNSSCSPPCSGAIDLNPSGGFPPYSYATDNILGNPISVTMPMNNLCPGLYKVYLMDSNGCDISYTVAVLSNDSIPGINANLNVINTTCINSSDGFIGVNLSGSNLGPFTYLWNPDNETTQNINNAVPKIYMVTVYDTLMNCITLSDTIHANNGYCGTIKGNIFIDNNSDCLKNSGDVNCITAGVVANPGNRVGYTDLLGNYYINNLQFGTYTITPDNYMNSVLGTCASSVTLVVNNTNPYINVANFPMGYTSLTQPDVQVSAYTNGIVPGFNCNINFSLCNLNNVPSNGFYKAILPAGIISNIINIIPSVYTISGDTIIWNYNNITSSSGCTNFTIYFTTPLSMPLGSIFTACALATGSDFDLTNNYYCYDKIVTGSFDPNDKSVSPVGSGANGNITLNDSILTYLIRFQNTGNGPAQTVIVSDSISPFLDITTFQMINSSHVYNIEISASNVINWTFNNIALPDSNTNEPNSHGFIHYKIKQKPNNSIGTKIKNTAYIYFDYNQPVITNTTLNTIGSVSSIQDIFNKQKVNLYPNPTNSTITINSQKTFKKIDILSITGQTILTETVNTKSHQLQLQNLAEGIYLIRIIYNNGEVLTGKITKQ